METIELTNDYCITYILGDSGSRHLNKLNTESALKLKEPNQKEIFFIEAVELLTVNKVSAMKLVTVIFF